MTVTTVILSLRRSLADLELDQEEAIEACLLTAMSLLPVIEDLPMRANETMGRVLAESDPSGLN